MKANGPAIGPGQLASGVPACFVRDLREKWRGSGAECLRIDHEIPPTDHAARFRRARAQETEDSPVLCFPESFGNRPANTQFRRAVTKLAVAPKSDNIGK